MNIQEIELDRIIIGTRIRKNVGDVNDLCENISAVGLLHPVVLTSTFQLVAGQRRIEAFRQLGHATIPVHIVDNFADARTMLLAERGENICRRDFTPREAVASGKRLKKLMELEAKERQRERKGNQPGAKSGQSPELPKGNTRDLVGQCVGMSGKTFERAEAVVDAAEADPETYGPIADEMDAKRGHGA